MLNSPGAQKGLGEAPTRGLPRLDARVPTDDLPIRRESPHPSPFRFAKSGTLSTALSEAGSRESERNPERLVAVPGFGGRVRAEHPRDGTAPFRRLIESLDPELRGKPGTPPRLFADTTAFTADLATSRTAT